MADISITEANVQIGTGARSLVGTTAEAITIGSPVAINRSNSNLLYESDSNDSVNTYRQAVNGLALSKGLGVNQLITYIADQSINFGSAILEPGMIYVSSPNVGKICPFTDLAIFIVSTTQITSNVATYTTAIPHAFVTGQTVTIAGCSNSYYNGAFVVASTPTTTTFTVALVHANNGPNSETTGTSQIKGIVVNIIGIAIDTQNLKLLINGVNGNTGISR